MPQSSSPRHLSSHLRSDSELLHAREDKDFDEVYPLPIRDLSGPHWSPVNVCRLAAKLLAPKPGVRVLDIGCGPGKFCMVGAAVTAGHFTGIERRLRFVKTARDLVELYSLTTVQIIHGNVTDFDFQDYEAFYLYNPFEENVLPPLRIDSDVVTGPNLYTEYVHCVQHQVRRMPTGTRVITYSGDDAEIPEGYLCQELAFDDELKLWVKQDMK